MADEHSTVYMHATTDISASDTVVTQENLNEQFIAAATIAGVLTLLLILSLVILVLVSVFKGKQTIQTTQEPEKKAVTIIIAKDSIVTEGVDMEENIAYGSMHLANRASPSCT